MHRVFLIVALASVIVSGRRVDVFERGFWAHVRANLWCKGVPLEAWAFLKTAEHPPRELVSAFTIGGLLDITANARHDFGMFEPPISPGFLVSIKADCGCGGEYFELPLVPDDYQFEDYSIEAMNHPYEYGVLLDLANCSARRNPHIN
uniref:Transthyretin-like family protein n=1 Tax=Panagrellus redivivus TaxID=6233 RepID=A0A7E4ZW12_PANRE